MDPVVEFAQRATEAEAKSATLLADLARASTALAAGKQESAQDILMAALLNAMNFDRMAVIDVVGERQRQIDVEGRTPEYDDAHTGPEALAKAVAAFALAAAGGAHTPSGNFVTGQDVWPFGGDGFRPHTKDLRRLLVIAGALTLAAIESLDRAQLRNAVPPPAT